MSVFTTEEQQKLRGHFLDAEPYENENARIVVEGNVVKLFMKSPEHEVVRRFKQDPKDVFYFRYLLGFVPQAIYRTLYLGWFLDSFELCDRVYTTDIRGSMNCAESTPVEVGKVYSCDARSVVNPIYDFPMETFPYHRMKNPAYELEQLVKKRFWREKVKKTVWDKIDYVF